MLDQDFYQFLEYGICKAFQHSQDEALNGFWCDGVLPLSNHDYSRKSINDNKKITLKAFIGKDGQSVYELTLRLGARALSRYARGLDLKECVPNPDKPDWCNINTQKKTIEIRLD